MVSGVVLEMYTTDSSNGAVDTSYPSKTSTPESPNPLTRGITPGLSVIHSSDLQLDPRKLKILSTREIMSVGMRDRFYLETRDTDFVIFYICFLYYEPCLDKTLQKHRSTRPGPLFRNSVLDNPVPGAHLWNRQIRWVSLPSRSSPMSCAFPYLHTVTVKQVSYLYSLPTCTGLPARPDDPGMSECQGRHSRLRRDSVRPTRSLPQLRTW